jgi:hypothetical protein
MAANSTPIIRVTAMPADTNPYGGVFGGWIMSQMALAAGSLASRHFFQEPLVSLRSSRAWSRGVCDESVPAPLDYARDERKS